MKHIKPLSTFLNESVNEGVNYQDIAKELVEIAAYYTDVDLSSDMTNALKCDDAKKVSAFYGELLDMMKSEEPGRYKEFDKEAVAFLQKNKISESVNEGGDENLENYMFFGNLNTIKKHAEMILALDPSQVDAILSNGHDWANDHIATSKDDIEEVCNFLQNETKEAGSGKVPESNANEAMVQVAGKSKPAGAKVLATVMVQFMEQNKMLDSNFTASAHGGKNQKYMIDELANFIMDNTF